MKCVLVILLLGLSAVYGQFKDWWETASLYQIYPRSYKDSNGDGIGDLNGITANLQYLKDTGIDAAWMSPIFKSPMVDFGYDISDFYSIQPEYGNMGDFEVLIQSANRIGIKIILDFVPNHSSDKNEWFLKSELRDPFYKDYYIWHPGRTDPANPSGRKLPPSNWLSHFRGSAWEWSDIRKEYYLHLFAKQQPDLNYRDPKVVNEMKNVLRFWLDKGVAGFRIDTIPDLFEQAPDNDGNFKDEPLSGNTNDKDDYNYLNHIYTVDQDETFDMVTQWRKVLDDHKTLHGGPTRILLTEAYSSVTNTMRYFGNDTHPGSHIPFNFFPIMSWNKMSKAEDFKNAINQWLDNVPKGRTSNWVIGNHDQSRVATRLGPARVDVINMIMKLLPGVSVTYQGEEIGMENVWLSWEETVDPPACNSDPQNYEKYSRDPARTPLQWNNSTSAGFSTNPKTWLPVGSDYRTRNIESQQIAKVSNYKVYLKLQEARQGDVLKYGDVHVSTQGPNVLLIERTYGYYVVLAYLNVGDKMELMPAREEEYAKVITASVFSERIPGDLFYMAEDFILAPNEGLVLSFVR